MLVLQVIGVLLLAAVLRTVLAGDSAVSMRRAVGLAAAVLAGVVFWTDIYPNVQSQRRAREANAMVPRPARDIVGGNIIGAREDVLAWAEGQVARDARVYLECGEPSGCGNGVNEWITWRLRPRFFADTPQQADVALLYGVAPRRVPYARGWRIVSFAPTFALARRPR